MFLKKEKVRLKGNKLKKLNEQIHERDGYSCICCGSFVALGEKFHHEPCGPNKEDRIECGVLLCVQCHYERHNGALSQTIKKKCEDYLNDMYRSE